MPKEEVKPEAAETAPAPAPETRATAPAASEADAPAPAAPTPGPVPGTCFVAHPEKIGATIRGHALEPDKAGKILVSPELAEELAAHGFKVV